VAQGEASIRVYLSPKAKDSFKTTCFLKGLNMSDVAAELIEDWLKNNAVGVVTEENPPSPDKGKGAA
jgi:hypothetical protein